MENYDVLNILGKGSFGTISKIRRKVDEMSYEDMSEREKELIVNEVNILRELRHPYIVKYYDRIINQMQGKIYIIMEYLPGGDLRQLLKKYRKAEKEIEEDYIWRILSQLLSALERCHYRMDKGLLKPILHRDIKPENIFLDPFNDIKLGDFGLAKILNSKSAYATTNVGTPYYMSPELIKELKYNEKSDIWAIGCLIYELAAKKPPFEGTNQFSLAKRIIDGKYSQIPSHYSNYLREIIREMIQIEPAMRPDIHRLQAFNKLKPYNRETQLCVREYDANRLMEMYFYLSLYSCNLNRNSKKMKELYNREEIIKRKEAELKQLEMKLKMKEMELYGNKKYVNFTQQQQQQQQQFHINNNVVQNIDYTKNRTIHDRVNDFLKEEAIMRKQKF